MAKVAFLGLGVMGFPMAGHLVKKGGHEVTVYNRTAAKAKQWADKFGGKTAATPKAAAEGQDFVMCCVGNDHDLRAVTVGAEGAFAGVKKGAVFVDHTTASAEVARELDAAAAKRGFNFGFAVEWMRKDLSICIAEARRNGANLPVTALVDQFYAEVEKMGGKRWDTSSLLARLER